MAITHPSQCRFRKFYEDLYGWTPPMFTYIVTCEGTDLLKFGRSATPEWRLVMLQTGCPHKLDIPWAWPEDVEKDLHRHFANQRVNGEWFCVPLKNAIWVAGMLTKIKYRQELSLQRQSQ